MRVTHSGFPKKDSYYEYTILLINPIAHDADAVLNRFGSQRWRLVNIWPDNEGRMKAVLMRLHKAEAAPSPENYKSL